MQVPSVNLMKLAPALSGPAIWLVKGDLVLWGTNRTDLDQVLDLHKTKWSIKNTFGFISVGFCRRCDVVAGLGWLRC